VLVAGGIINPSLKVVASAERYDPGTGTWSAAGNMAAARAIATATLLPNGMVLVAGGAAGGSALASTELYDPASASWTAGPDMILPRQHNTATPLSDGRVLFAGGLTTVGDPLASAELYDRGIGS
jgi:hypothetical protein